MTAIGHGSAFQSPNDMLALLQGGAGPCFWLRIGRPNEPADYRDQAAPVILERVNMPPNPDKSHHDSILHHLAELERLIEQHVAQWAAEDAIHVQQRLDRLSAMMRRIAAELRGH